MPDNDDQHHVDDTDPTASPAGEPTDATDDHAPDSGVEAGDGGPAGDTAGDTGDTTGGPEGDAPAEAATEAATETGSAEDTAGDAEPAADAGAGAAAATGDTELADALAADDAPAPGAETAQPEPEAAQPEPETAQAERETAQPESSGPSEPSEDRLVAEEVAPEPDAGASVWAEATSEAPAAESEPTEDTADEREEPAASGPRLSAVRDEDDEDRESAGAGAGFGGADDPARQLISTVEGFLGSVFRDASEAVDKLATRGREEARKNAERAADPSEFLESVESWVGDFFRGAPGKAARGFGKAAAGSALRSATGGTKNEDVWASATSEEAGRDASRECRYCPFCQTLAAVRSTKPELYDQIGDTAKTLVDLVKQAAEQSKGRRPWR